MFIRILLKKNACEGLMVDGNRYVTRATTKVNSCGAASLMKQEKLKSQHLLFQGWALPVSLYIFRRLRERKKLCRSSLLPTLGPVGIHNHVLPPHSSDEQENIKTQTRV